MRPTNGTAQQLLLLLFARLSLPHPIPEESSTTISSSSNSSTTEFGLKLRVLPAEDEKEEEEVDPDSSDHSAITIDGADSTSHNSKRHTSTPSPAELEEKRQAFIKSLGGGEDSAPVLVSSISGLGTLVTDFVALLTTNANETFAPLREAKQKAKQNFPNFGTQVNSYLRNGREYASRAYRAFLKNANVKVTNILRLILQGITRLSREIGGVYQILVSVLDVVTRGVQVGARVGSRLLTVGSNVTVNALSKGTTTLRSLGESGVLIKPFNRAVMVGRTLAKGLTEDFFDLVEWTQEGLNSKLELGAALAPNFLLRAHENPRKATTSSPPPKPEEGEDADVDSKVTLPSPPELFVSYKAGGSGSTGSIGGGYAKLTDENDDLLGLGGLGSASELSMMRGGREVTASVAASTTATEEPDHVPPQNLLNDIFGLEQEVVEQKKANCTGGKEEGCRD